MDGRSKGTPILRQLLADVPDEVVTRLVQTMLDDDVPPNGLNGVERTRAVTVARKPPLDLLTKSLSTLPAHRHEQIWDELGQSSKALYRDRGPGLVHAVVAWAVQPLYFALPDSLFQPADPNSRLFQAHPELLQQLDKKGLLAMDPSWNVGSQILMYEAHGCALLGAVGFAAPNVCG
jgi:hypothetical protein